MSEKKREAFGNISKDAAQVFFASGFVAYLYGQPINIGLSLSGLVMAVVLWGLYVTISAYE